MKAARRNKLKKSQFGDPANRKYPIDTPGRAANAKARATQQAKKGNISASKAGAIKARANRALKRMKAKRRR